MKVIVTGATSMIGVALIQQCLQNHDDVVAIVRPNTNRMKRLPQSDHLTLAYSDLEHLSELDIDGEYDVLYHFAWGPNVKSARDDCKAQEKNIKATLDAIDLAHRTGCKKFVCSGSQAEYGPNNALIDTNTICRPNNAYGMCKLSASMLAQKYCEQLEMDCVWGRIFSVYGTNDNDGTMLDYAIRTFIKKETAHFSSGKQSWNYLFEEDAGKMFYLLGKKKVDSGIYNIASHESRPLRTYIEECMEVFGKDATCEFAKVNSDQVYGINVDITKTIQAIDYVPQVSFKEGIRKMIDKIKQE